MATRVLPVLPEERLRELDELWLAEDGRFKLLPAEAYRVVDQDTLSCWCQYRGRYQVPTLELVEFIRERIGNRRAIEVGAGNGSLGYHLGIRMRMLCCGCSTR